MSQIEKDVIKIISKTLKVEEAKIVPEASFSEDLGADSLDNVELVMALEQFFHREIPDQDSQKLLKVKDAIEYITSRVTAEQN